MADKYTVKELLEASTDGTITAEQVTAAGLHRSVLQELVDDGELYRYARGLYVRSNAWVDDLYLLQRRYGRGIYSHDTALYLLDYSDRTPTRYTMTFPKGYNAQSMKKENILIKRVVPENYTLGVIEVNSPFGNPLRIYDLERTLCSVYFLITMEPLMARDTRGQRSLETPHNLAHNTKVNRFLKT